MRIEPTDAQVEAGARAVLSAEVSSAEHVARVVLVAAAAVAAPPTEPNAGERIKAATEAVQQAMAGVLAFSSENGAEQIARAAIAASEAEIDRLNHEVAAHQVSDGYEKGHEHGSRVAVRYKSERDAAIVRAENAEALNAALRAAQEGTTE